LLLAFLVRVLLHLHEGSAALVRSRDRRCARCAARSGHDAEDDAAVLRRASHREPRVDAMRRRTASSRRVMSPMFRPAQIFLCVALAALTRTAQAQTRISSADSAVYARARQLVQAGNGAAGRVLVDSMATVATPDTP